MPVEIGIWKLGKHVEKVSFSPIQTENKLEGILAEDISILDPRLLVIGRQVVTDYGKCIDLLAMDADGNLIVIELKRDCTPREVVAQILDYGSWVCKLHPEEIASIFNKFIATYRPVDAGKSLDDAYCEKFHVKVMPEDLNESHELCVVVSELDSSAERIVTYLAEQHGVGINVAFFRFFKDGDNEYLSRAWLIDSTEVQAQTTENVADEPWNGEFYVSFGDGEHRHWEDARKYGYISAGGGDWYAQTLEMLEPGARIWVNVPGRGYVGVGKVREKAEPQTVFQIETSPGTRKSIKDVFPYVVRDGEKPDEIENFVSVEWIKTVPIEEAVRERGFFGNQNSAARPKTKKWRYTIDRLKTLWGIESMFRRCATRCSSEIIPR